MNHSVDAIGDTVVHVRISDESRLKPEKRVGRHAAAIFTVLSMYAFAAAAAERPPAWNSDESKVGPYTLPDPLVCLDGSRVSDAQAWSAKRRGEILDLFNRYEYGKTPGPAPKVMSEVTAEKKDAVGGLATRTLVTLRFYDDADAPVIHLMFYVPNGATKPAPVLLGLNYWGNASVEADPAIPITRQWMRASTDQAIVDHHPTEGTRGSNVSRWPLALALKRGYGVATFFYGDMEPDNIDGWQTGLRGYLAKKKTGATPANEWGALGAWAWGLSRALDYLQTVPAVDAKRVAVFGHSRQGKAALWAGAQDQRFALVISNDSGKAGASLARRDFGETIAFSIATASWRFNDRYRDYINRAADLPVDQHMLLALVAPRPLYIASATEDHLADPRGEFLSAVNAEPVYRLFGFKGLDTTTMPAPDHSIGSRIGYHIRTGKHDITAYDWERYMDFADRNLKAAGK